MSVPNRESELEDLVGVVTSQNQINLLQGYQCRTCNLISLPDQRFFRDIDPEPFVVLQDLRRISPLLLFKSHLVCTNREVLKAFRVMKEVCQQFFDGLYVLHPCVIDNHVVIQSGPIFLLSSHASPVHEHTTVCQLSREIDV